MTRCAVLGSPIAHSLSPVLHRAAYQRLGLHDWSYDRFELQADGLADFVAECERGGHGGGPWRGLSLTMPLKEAVLALGDVDETAALAHAGNTLIFTEHGRQITNTDVGGKVWAIRRLGVDGVRTVVILGAGATARSSLISAVRLGATSVTVVARTPAKAAGMVQLGGQLGVPVRVVAWGEPLPVNDLLISTVTSGAPDAYADEASERSSVIFDALYHPWPTRLAAVGLSAGRPVANGLDLLVGQAMLQLELMTGQTVDPDLLLSAGRAALGARSGA